MGELPSLFVGSSSELLLAEAAQGLGRWVFWAAAGLIVLFAALLLRRIRALHSRTGKLLALSAFLPLFLQAAIYWLYNLGWWPLGVLSLPFLSYGVFFLLVDAALAGVLLSVFRMDALVRDTAWASSAPAPGPPLWTSPWAGDSSTSNTAKGRNTFKHTKEACGKAAGLLFLFLVRPVGHEHILPVLHAPSGTLWVRR